MEQIDQIVPLRQRLQAFRQAGERIAFVPTMGNLHQGHLELVRQARQRAERVAVSIYVNPTQFGVGEDLQSYPRTLAEDCQQLEREGVDLLFTPSDAVMYGEGARDSLTRVEVPLISDQLCGASRPGHFSGVATVVSKLFNIVQPELALFGEKDFQQLLVIRRLVEELCFPLQVVAVPTVREEDGLAMSSRNGYLSPQQRKIAPELNRVLRTVCRQLQEGRTDYAALETEWSAALQAAGFVPDYLSIRQQNLEFPSTKSKKLVVLAAAQLGTTRLIDNCPLVLR
jgi:pantoate--beta-alanine ligase